MIETKIQLSRAEMDLMCDTNVILTKNKVLEKIRLLLELMQQQMVDYVKANNDLARLNIFQIPPKISKGENYLGLPYLILDYPRVFQQNETFAIRTFFWWGSFFSSTYHVAGNYKNEVQHKIEDAYPLLMTDHYLCINPDPWQHHFKEDNYLPIKAFKEEQFKNQLSSLEHIKIAAKWPLTKWDSSATTLLKNWKFFLQMYLT